MNNGLNTRTTETEALKGPEQAEQWNIDFMLKTMDALSDSLPEKFYLGGHSYGGYLSSLYASFKPERVEALFLISPAIESYKPDQYNPYGY